jgi:hypothetical protein
VSGVRPDLGQLSGSRTIGAARSWRCAQLALAPPLLFVRSTHQRRKEIIVLQKRTFKVLAAIPKRDGGHWWMKCGSGHTNRDDSINVYLDAVPKDLRFTLRELDDEDLRRREAYRATHGDPGIPESTDAIPVPMT